MDKITSLRLRNFPQPIKALALGYILALALAYCYALGNIFLVVGLTPKDIAIHYYGSTQKIETNQNTQNGETELNLDETVSQPLPQPSFKTLVAEGHFHLFGMTSFFFGLTILGLFVSVSEKVKSMLVFFPYIAVVIDNLSFMATRFLGPKWSLLTVGAGSLMGLSFTILWVLIIRELIAKRSEA